MDLDKISTPNYLKRYFYAVWNHVLYLFPNLTGHLKAI